MGSQHHIIQREVFDINFNSEQKAFELQNRVSALFYNRLENAVLHIFDSMVSEDTLVRCDILELDLGILPFEEMEDQLPDRLKEALEQALKDQFSLSSYYPATGGGGESSVSKSSPLNLLAYFLITGSLPWWASGPVMTNPGTVAEELLQREPEALRFLILKLGQFAYVRRRLVFQFHEEIIQAVISILEPGEARFILGYHRELVNTQQQTHTVEEEISEVKKAVWLFILTYLLAERGTEFNQKMFVKSTLRQMAAHYNLKYEGILRLFSVSLNNQPQIGRSLPLLGRIIKDLYAEQSLVSPRADGEERAEGEKPSERESRSREMIIEYYLQYGTLPPWADQYSSGQLNVLFHRLSEATPVIARALILGMENKGAGIQNIMTVFDNIVINKIIKLVEPANSEFIIHYIERTESVQNAKSIVKTDHKSFNQSLRQFVLTYLLIDRGSVFNTRMFLEGNIRQMAHRYNFQFEVLLSLLIEEIKGQSSGVKIPLLYLLTEVQQEHKRMEKEKNDEVLFFSGDKARFPEGKDLRVYNRTLSDILRFWVMYGFIPWWGKKYSNKSPAGMWEALYASNAEVIVKLVKYAGTGPGMKQRIVYQLPLPVFLATFAEFPQGQEAIKIYEFVTDLLTRLPQWRIKNKAAQQNILMLGWWDAFIATGYAGFDPYQFISLIIHRLSQWTGLFAAAIHHSLRKVVRDYRLTHTGHLPPSEEILISIMESPLRDISDRESDAPLDIRALIGQYVSPGKRDSEEEVLRESLRILEYFLTWNKWPYKIPGNLPVKSDIFLKNLIRLLIREKPAALRNIIQQDGHAPSARIQIHDAFSLSTDYKDKDIHDLLHEFLHRDIVEYFNDRTGLSVKEGDQRFLEILDKKLLHDHDSGGRSLLRTLLNSPSISSFITEKYSNEMFYRLVENAADDKGKETVPFLHQMEDLLSLAIPDTLAREKIIFLFRRFSLYYLAGSQTQKTPVEYFALFFKMVGNGEPARDIKLYRSLLEIIHRRLTPSRSFPAGLIVHLEEHLRKLIEAEAVKAGFKQDLTETGGFPPLTQSGFPVIAPVPLHHRESPVPALAPKPLLEKYRGEAAEKKRAKELLQTEEETIYIRNAGLVLLHPFLDTYFSKTGLTKEGKFADEEAIFRSVHLLQFLADGKEQHPEHELVLNKILCGLPVEEPVPAEISITQQEKEVSMELLKVVMQQWEKMKNTSMEGFRASFLQRDGGLTVAPDNSWKLRIEQRGYDVLLQTLPWGIGMIKTPWMENFLYVEWA